MKKKILFLHHAAGLGGAPISMINTIKGLDKNKFDAFVLLLQQSAVIELLSKEGIKYEVIPDSFYRKYYKYFSHGIPTYVKWYQIGKLLKNIVGWILTKYYFSSKILKNYQYDIIHLNSTFLTDWISAGKKYGKTVVHVREPLANGYFGIRRYIVKHHLKKYADHIIAISKDNALRIGLEEKTSVVYNFTKIGALQELTNNYTKYVLYLGGSVPYKGFFTVVEALNYINKNIKIIVAGHIAQNETGDSSAIKNSFKKLIPHHRKKRNAIQMLFCHKQVDIVGFCNNIDELFIMSDFLISPFSKEHFSRPVIEAFAHGKPAIGTDVQGMAELIDHGINGLIVTKNDPKKLAEAINYLSVNPGILEKMGKNAYEKAQNKYSTRNIQKIVEIYEQIGSQNENHL